MVTKVLIAEDEDSDNLGIVSKLQKFTNAHIDTAQFCDKAEIMIKRGLQENLPYHLLISDLSFIKGHKKHKIIDGKQLINVVKQAQPEIKIIVFSQENKPAIIKSLFENYNINGYVCKGLYGLQELIKAIDTVIKNDISYTCPVAKEALHQNNILQINSYEVLILQLLAKGYKQEEISQHFIINSILPNSKRSIEDRLRKLRDEFNAKTNIELVVIANKLGLIS